VVRGADCKIISSIDRLWRNVTHLDVKLADALLSFRVTSSNLNILNATSPAASMLKNNRFGAFVMKQFSLASGYDAIVARSVKQGGGYNLLFINQNAANNAIKLSENFSLKSNASTGVLNLR
jgi:hypothetical protein